MSSPRGQYQAAPTDQSIGVYSHERSITDAFRLRGTLGYEIGRGAHEMAPMRREPAHLSELATELS